MLRVFISVSDSKYNNHLSYEKYKRKVLGNTRTNYLFNNALTNVAIYEKDVHGCNYVYNTGDDTVKIIILNALQQKSSLIKEKSKRL